MQPAFEKGQGVVWRKPNNDVPEGLTGAGEQGGRKSRCAEDGVKRSEDECQKGDDDARLVQPGPEALVVILVVLPVRIRSVVEILISRARRIHTAKGLAGVCSLLIRQLA